ncbi:methionyl-tRNA formyltransferase, partial [Spizellomyces punctatus DAOM BR117]
MTTCLIHVFEATMVILQRSCAPTCFPLRCSTPLGSILCRGFHVSHQWNRPYNILFFGSDEFSIASLRKLREEQVLNPGSIISHIEVVTPPDNPRNKKAEVPLKEFAVKEGLTVHSAPPKTLKDWTIPNPSYPAPFDLAVVVSFGYFLPRRVIGAFPSGAFNIHPSLLPRYRGAAPIQYTILNDDKETGVSIIELDPQRFDVGGILKQTRIEVPPKVFFKDLHDALAEVGAKDMLETIRELDKCQAQAIAQNDGEATHAPKIPKAMGVVDWQLPRERIYRLHRAIGYRIPLHTTFRGRRVQLLALDDPDSATGPGKKTPNDLPPGALAFDDEYHTLFIKCSDGWLACSKLKVEGKRALGIRDFVNGYQLADAAREFFK